MAQIVTLKLETAGPRIDLFTITDNLGNVIATDVSRETLKKGVSYSVDDNATTINIASKGGMKVDQEYSISAFPSVELNKTVFTEQGKACLWKHLKNPTVYNKFYGNTEPYILEYPFAYQYHDQILTSVQDYTKVYKYIDNGPGPLVSYGKYEVDDTWFNKAILYNGQQNSGVLNLVAKPKNNLSSYMTYPVFNTDSKDILYTKSDNFYQYNTFWDIINSSLKTATPPLQFKRTCENLSIDKEINQFVMDYSKRSHKKATLRAKDLKIRHILDNKSNAKLVSQFIFTPTQISYK